MGHKCINNLAPPYNIYPLYLIQDSASAKDLIEMTLTLIYQNVDWLQVSTPLLSVAQRVLTPSLKTSIYQGSKGILVQGVHPPQYEGLRFLDSRSM